MQEHYTSDSALINDIIQLWDGKRKISSVHTQYNSIGNIWRQIRTIDNNHEVRIVNPRDDSIFVVTFAFDIHYK